MAAKRDAGSTLAACAFRVFASFSSSSIAGFLGSNKEGYRNLEPKTAIRGFGTKEPIGARWRHET